MNKQTILNAYVACSRKLISSENDIEANRWGRTVRGKDGEPTEALDKLKENLFANKAVLLRQLACFLSRLEVAPVGKLEARQWDCKISNFDITEIKPDRNQYEESHNVIVRIYKPDGTLTYNCHSPEQALEMANHLKVLAVKALESQGRLEHATAT